MPRYPHYQPQPYTGDLPSMVEVGASDMRYTSNLGPAYQAPFDRRYGRRLAGTDVDVSDESAEPGWALNELNLYAEMDDVQGNGVFDPPGTHPNIHPDAGVFAARASLPGYHAREVPFSRTEIVDSTTGRPVVAVPSGAVSLDSAAQIAFIEQGLWKKPRPVVRWEEASPMPSASITNWMQDPQTIPPSVSPSPSSTLTAPALSRVPMGGFGEGPAPTPTSPFASTAVKVLLVGASAGVLYALFRKKK